MPTDVLKDIITAGLWGFSLSPFVLLIGFGLYKLLRTIRYLCTTTKEQRLIDWTNNLPPLK